MGTDLEELSDLLHGVGNNQEAMLMELLSIIKDTKIKYLSMLPHLKVI